MTPDDRLQGPRALTIILAILTAEFIEVDLLTHASHPGQTARP